jgi:hypothetical protein
MAQSEEQRNKANVRLALGLALAAVLFGLGFVAKVIWFGR